MQFEKAEAQGGQLKRGFLKERGALKALVSGSHSGFSAVYASAKYYFLVYKLNLLHNILVLVSTPSQCKIWVNLSETKVTLTKESANLSFCCY